MSRGRDWARRAMLSALAGGGLTAAPMAGGALAAENSPGSIGGPASSSGEQASQASSAETTTTTTSTGTTPAPSTTPSSTTPAASPPAPAANPTPSGSSAQPQSSSKHPTEQRPSHAPRQSSANGGARAKGHAKPNSGGTAPPPAPLVPSPVQVAPPTASGNIAPAPQLAAGQAVAPSPLLSGSLASLQALSFYRVPLFLLPIYQAAASQYGVPWQILAAINEVETDYGTDVSVSTAGAIGWMQFMPETWLQYGVDAVNAGYADPYNPVDAIFAAARYLHAAGASSDLKGAICSYNPSEAYVQSVLLRARLISSYPQSVIATLTGLTEGSVPVQGAKLLSAGAPSTGEAQASAGSAVTAPAPSATTASLPGTTPAPAPAKSAANAAKLANAPAPLSQLSLLEGPKDAPVLAVEDGRIVQLGRSRKLGRYIVLRDTYGDVFTYAGLGSIVPSYRLPKPTPLSVPKGALRGGQTGADPTPQQAATAGRQLPLTLHVAAKKEAASAQGDGSAGPIAPAPVGSGKVRVFAHPGNPDALAAARSQVERSKIMPAGSNVLRSGSLVAQGTILGHLGAGGESSTQHGYLRFAVRPQGAQQAIDPGPVLHNWAQLDTALHPQGAKGGNVLAGATAGGAFLLSAGELERSVLSDPGIRLNACDRRQVAAGKVDRRALALLVFLSRSGLKPTVGELSCGRASYRAGTLHTSYLPGGTLTITAVNGVPVAGHQGAGTITDVTIRTLLTANGRFAPKQIVSLMQYPGVSATVAKPDHADLIEVSLPARAAGPTALVAAHAASAGRPAGAPADLVLGSAQWSRLIARIGGLADPKVSRKPSRSAVRDQRH
ncbi:MAG: lytic murein transglycosylase [Solirubrobacteraceae bacterium]